MSWDSYITDPLPRVDSAYTACRCGNCTGLRAAFKEATRDEVLCLLEAMTSLACGTQDPTILWRVWANHIQSLNTLAAQTRAAASAVQNPDSGVWGDN